MIIDIAWIYTVGFGMIFLCQQLSHWNCAIPTYKSRAQSRWTERKREEAKGTFFFQPTVMQFWLISFFYRVLYFFIIDLCKKISNGIWTNVASNYVNVHWEQVLICSQTQVLASSNAFGYPCGLLRRRGFTKSPHMSITLI